MDWLNLHSSILDSPEVVGAEPTDRGTWLMLLRYCMGQENGGLIEDCAGWKDRKWQQLARVTLSEVKRESELWAWSDNDLTVIHYPLEKEELVRVKRENAKTNGRSGGRPKRNPEETNVGLPEKPTLVVFPKAEGKGREGEGKGMEKEGEVSAAAAVTPMILETIRLAYPRHTHMQDTLICIAAAVRRNGGDHATILAGCRNIAAKVKDWPENERLQFLKNPPDFFSKDLWNDDPEYWRSKAAGRKFGSAPSSVDIGGRRAAGVITSHLE